MSLRFTSQLCIDNLPDEQLNNQFEVIMPSIDIVPKSDKEENTITKLANKQSKSNTIAGKLQDKVSGFFSNTIYAYSPIVEEITFGYKNFKVDTRRVRTGWFGVPSDIERFHEVKITMFCPASMETQYYLEAWRRLIFNEAGEFYHPFSNYKKNIEIYIKGPGNQSKVGSLLGAQDCHITLQGCFPYLEKDFEFEYTDDPKRFRILATFNVDNVKVDNSATKKAIIEGMITSPTSMLDKVLSGEGTSTYSIGDTYGGVTDGKSTSESAWSRVKSMF